MHATNNFLSVSVDVVDDILLHSSQVEIRRKWTQFHFLSQRRQINSFLIVFWMRFEFEIHKCSLIYFISNSCVLIFCINFLYGNNNTHSRILIAYIASGRSLNYCLDIKFMDNFIWDRNHFHLNFRFPSTSCTYSSQTRYVNKFEILKNSMQFDIDIQCGK